MRRCDRDGERRTVGERLGAGFGTAAGESRTSNAKCKMQNANIASGRTVSVCILNFAFCISSTRSLLRLRQQHLERRAAAWRGLDFDLAVVHLDDPVDHRQPDTRSMILRREVQVKDAAEVLRGDADAGVLDPQLDPRSRAGAARQPKRSAVGHRLTGIDRQIQDRLPQHRRRRR